eukprot:17604-Heterococcus_DN1.PRE.3
MDIRINKRQMTDTTCQCKNTADMEYRTTIGTPAFNTLSALVIRHSPRRYKQQRQAVIESRLAPPALGINRVETHPICLCDITRLQRHSYSVRMYSNIVVVDVSTS